MISSNVLAMMLVLVAAVSAFNNVANVGLKCSAIKASYFDNMAAGSWGVPSTSAPAAPAPSAPVSTPSFSDAGSADFYGNFGKGGKQMSAPLTSGKTVGGTSQGYFDDLVGKEVAFSAAPAAPAAAAAAPASTGGSYFDSMSAGAWGASSAPAAAAPAPVSTPSFSDASSDFYGNFGKGGKQMTAPLTSGKTVGGTSQGYFDDLVGKEVAFSAAPAAPAAAAAAPASTGGSYFDSMSAGAWGASSAPAAAAPAPVSTPSFSDASSDFYGNFGKGGKQMTAPLTSGKTVGGTSQGYFDDLVGKEVPVSTGFTGLNQQTAASEVVDTLNQQLGNYMDQLSGRASAPAAAAPAAAASSSWGAAPTGLY